ncbi:hypothetical protein JL720_12807 [Aureococcus anophagefferens]|nr:hypothetical protein JL720_12807 [Aureococcus anophagefferens]
MLIGRERFEEVYNTIKQSACAGGACTVTPVAGYGDVAAATVDVADAFSEIRSVVMLNCGGTVNLEALFGGGAATIFVVDSHRPFHLRNVHSGGRVVVLDAEPLDAGDCPSARTSTATSWTATATCPSDEESDGGDDDDDEADGDNSDDGSRKRPRRALEKRSASAAGTVAFEAELRFMLHRHWPLFDAMYYSNYVAARLSVWKADGKRKLQELLAKIGLSLEHCKQRFAFLSEAQRASMKERLRDQGPAYDLDDPFTTSFHRVSASASSRDAAAIAYDACLPDDGALLAQGIRAATLLQRSVVQQAVSMVEKKEITTLRHFRYAYITSATSDVFAKPLAVRKLALFLLGVHQHNGNRGASKNRLAHAFKLAAEHIKADVAHDWFDSAVIEVLHDDVQRFVESLHYIMQHVN